MSRYETFNHDAYPADSFEQADDEQGGKISYGREDGSQQRQHGRPEQAEQ